MVVDIELHEPHAALRFVDDLFEQRRQLLARPAPRRPEIDKDGLPAGFLDHVRGKRRRAGILDLAAARAIRFLSPAKLPGGRHLAATGAAVWEAEERRGG